MDVSSQAPGPVADELNPEFGSEITCEVTSSHVTHCNGLHVMSGLGGETSTKETLPSLSTTLNECLPDCLCSVIPIENTDGPANTTTLDVDEIYQVLGKDILRSSLLEDIGLYLECDEDSLDAVPSNGLRRPGKPGKNGVLTWPASEVRLTWSVKDIATTEKQDTRYTCPECPKTFTRESLMRDHCYRVHGYQNLFPCGFCDYQGHCYRWLQKHIGRRHKDLITSPRALVKNTCLTVGSRRVAESESIVTSALETLASQTGLSKNLDVPLNSLSADQIANSKELDVKANSMIIKVKPKDGVIQTIPVPGTTCYIETEVVDESNFLDEQCGLDNSSRQSDVPIDTAEVLVKTNSIPVKPYNCDSCSYTCKSSRLLQRHKLALHNVEREVHCCDKCGRMFKQKRSLDTHMKVHGGLFEYHCDFCNKSFASADHLRLHRRVHIQSRDYVCSFPNCKLAFRTKGQLQQHERNVHGPRLFSCPEPGCDKDFALKRLADAHYKLHTAAYRCFHASCSRTFRDKHNLKVHQKTHRIQILQDKKTSTSPEAETE